MSIGSVADAVPLSRRRPGWAAVGAWVAGRRGSDDRPVAAVLSLYRCRLVSPGIHSGELWASQGDLVSGAGVGSLSGRGLRVDRIHDRLAARSRVRNGHLRDIRGGRHAVVGNVGGERRSQRQRRTARLALGLRHSRDAQRREPRRLSQGPVGADTCWKASPGVLAARPLFPQHRTLPLERRPQLCRLPASISSNPPESAASSSWTTISPSRSRGLDHSPPNSTQAAGLASIHRSEGWGGV